MKKPFESIAFKEVSYKVTLLHKMLGALGISVSKQETVKREAGADTRDRLQALLGPPAAGAPPEALVDGGGVGSLVDKLHQRGLLDGHRSFTVSGVVRSRDGSPKRRQHVFAFDLDLRAVARYRTVKTLADFAHDAGYDFLGHAVTDAGGNYSITFYDWQYRRAERGRADVVVFAVEPVDGGRVKGISRLVHSDDYSDRGVVQNLDVTLVGGDTGIEYPTVMAALEPFLAESKVPLVDIASSPEQLAFTARELDLELGQVTAAAQAAALIARAGKGDKRLAHELLYALARQGIPMDGASLYRRRDEDLRAAIAAAVKGLIIAPTSEAAVAAFLAALHELAVTQVLAGPQGGAPNGLAAMLASALPEPAQQAAFTRAARSFRGQDAAAFWTTHLPAQPEFRDQPEIISRLLLNQQLTLLSGNHQALVRELQVERGIKSVGELMDLDSAQWLAAVTKAGVPAFVAGDSEQAKAQRYAGGLQAALNASFPTQRIGRMIDKQQLPVEANVARGVSAFLAQTPSFDFAKARVHDFDQAITSAAGADAAAVKSELMKMQRVFQVSTSPEAMAVLLADGLHSAYSIANTPLKSFVKTYSKKMKGEREAFATHERAQHIAARTELAAARVYEYGNSYTPGYVYDAGDYAAAQTVLEGKIPNYSELFGSPDICECEHCRSVYSAASYFVDLLRFLFRSGTNDKDESPLDILKSRRPDLVHLPLSCENTNTVIPYIDLANEVMEYYTANGSLTDFEGYDTGETSAEELRANPQNFNPEAYKKLKEAKYPFTLPYHQPLDVIRTYSDHLKVSRYEAMQAVSPVPGTTAAQAIAAESLRLSQEEHQVLTGTAFDGTADTTALHVYFGYTASTQLESMSGVREFLLRSGVAYTDLVELVKTLFINPYQGTLDFLQDLFSYSSLSASDIYNKLKLIQAGTLDPASDSDISAVITAYNEDRGTAVTAAEFKQWVVDHLAEFLQVLTLYEPESKCALDTTSLRTIQSVYEGGATSGVSDDTWSKIHRFIRLWRKLGWTIHETDLMLGALGETDLTAGTIAKLEWVAHLKAATRLPINQLAVLWGAIDSYGDESLYKKLFLNKAVQHLDTAFEADAWGNYLADATALLIDHQSAILAAFRLREEDLVTIVAVSQVVDNGTARPIDLATDTLNLANLSTIYRHVVLAKALKLKVSELCTLITLLGGSPFSRWDIQQEKFIDSDPTATADFYDLAARIKAARFKAPVLEYIFTGTLAPDSTLGLDRAKTLQVAKAVRASFTAIEQDHPDAVPAPLPSEVLAAKLGLTFQADLVARLMAILDGTVEDETVTDLNLDVTIPDDLADRVTYTKGSGRLTAVGVLSDDDRTTLQGLTNASVNFQAAVEELYRAPEVFLADNFDGVFADLTDANAELLDHPAQTTASTLDDKLAYVYTRFVPLLKGKLRRDAVTQHVAALIGLSEEATALLIAAEVDQLCIDLPTEGLSASYFDDVAWTSSVRETTEPVIDFDWGSAAPDPAVPADNFSARWRAYLAAPASGEYTLVVAVTEADELFRLYLDDALILEKNAADSATSWEIVVSLNAAQMHALQLDYAEITGSAGVHLHWKTATRGLEVLPSSTCYPTAILDAWLAQATIYHRAAKLIAGFSLSETELDHFLSFASDFGNIDFTALDVAAWQRLDDYTSLRNAVPQSLALLTEVFAAANTATTPPPTVADLKAKLLLATAWDPTSVDYLVDTHFALAVSDFTNEIALNRVREVIEMVTRTGVSAQTLAGWGAVETDFDTLDAAAQELKNAVKAKYEEEDWLSVAGGLADGIRQHQQQALIAYLLTDPAIQAWGVEDADGLFEYFLIDVQMDACMDTSRIVQANSSVQMFVNRCLLNLESDLTSSGSEEGVSPGAIDKDRWEWMKAYRVWEANRKVFLYPENWLEPEWRNDKSEFFTELESYLVQNDITDRSVEQALRGYLASLNEVANLELCGSYRETDDDGNIVNLHVVARTHNGPYKYFYRTWDQYQKWSPWERVGVDIRGVEADDGGQDKAEDRSGVHLIPLVWKDRLFLFWPEFVEKEEKVDNGTKTFEDVGGENVSAQEPARYWEVRLAWSERVDDKWQPKQVSKEFIYQSHYEFMPNPGGERSLRFAAEIDHDSSASDGKDYLTLYLLIQWNDDDEPRDWYGDGGFELVDIASKVFAQSGRYGHMHETWDDKYRSDYMRVAAYAKLELDGDTFLNTETDHKILFSSDVADLYAQFEEPFFFSERHRSYFVRPVKVPVIERIREPVKYFPYIPDDFIFYPEREPPIRHVGPDDYIPSPEELVRFERFGELAGDRSVTRGRSLSRRVPAATAGPVIFDGPGAATSPPALEVQPMARFARSAGAMGADAGGRSMLMNYGKETWSLDRAFGGFEYSVDWGLYGAVSERTELEFHTFYHPYAREFVANLNSGEVEGLLESDTSLSSDEGELFETTYDPDLVHKPDDFAERTYYKENVCFDVYGANSCYNWELFFHAPLYVATRLSKNGQYEEAMKWFHYIFDPTTDALPGSGETEISRYWQVLPFKTTPATSLEDWFRTLEPNPDPNDPGDATIAEWRDNPFDPHLIASNRPLAYMKHVVLKYVDNLVAWGDSLFRQDTMETVNEAIQLYVLANHILGPRPEFVPRRGEIKIESYASLEDKWDDFSNALVELENIFPYSSSATVSENATGTSLLGVGPALYFCIPANDELLGHWDTVADRLYKIRHCLNIDGVFRKLALFSPPIDPALLIQATSQGLSLGSILADLSSPPPIHRFSYLVQKANELCSDVKALGGGLLAALEKKDGEELGRLRATNETQMLELTTAIRERQVLIARASKENLEKARTTASFRLAHYNALLGNDDLTVPATPTVSANLTADSQLPADTVIPTLQTDVDASLVESDERGVKIIPKEKEALDKVEQAKWLTLGANLGETLAGIFHLFPQIEGKASPLGVGAGAWWGGQNLGAATSAVAKGVSAAANFQSQSAGQASTMAGYIRREQDWTLQANLAAKEITQLDKQIVSAAIQVQVAEAELANHKQSIENSKSVERFLKNKFTGQELYQYMKEQLFAVYKQSYNLCYDMAKKAEKAYQYELGVPLASFIQYGYWDNSRQGLTSGERLQLALRQMEKSYIEENRRELELVKNISLARLDPLALIELRETGRCAFQLPEELFDLDFRGHYFRRIKGMRLSIPCVAGPHTSIGCSLRLLDNSIRTSTALNSSGNYEHENDAGEWIDDSRFRTNHVPVTAIATSQAQNDAGMFEFNFRDERLLPFERAGAISSWQLELSTEAELRQFDYATITDVVLHMSYTAREDGGLKGHAATYLQKYLTNSDEWTTQPLVQMFSMRHELPSEWYRFLHPAATGGEQILSFTLGKERFPFFVRDRDLVIEKVELFARCTQATGYDVVLGYVDRDENPVESGNLGMPQNPTYGNLNKATVSNMDAAGLDLEALDIEQPMSLKLKRSAVTNFTSLATSPTSPEDEVQDLFLVFSYKLV